MQKDHFNELLKATISVPKKRVMRELLLSLLKDQKRLTGIRQYEEIASNPNGKEAAQFELDALLKEMVDVCNKYPYISDQDKVMIIKTRMLDSTEFYGLNARFVFLALERVKHLYWKESSHQETNALLKEFQLNGYAGIPLEECSPETQKMVKEYTALLAAGTIKTVPKVNDHDLKVIQKEDEERVKPKAYSTTYKMPSENEIKIKEMHLLWIRECIHPQTKELIGLSETEWLLDKGYFIENGELKTL